MQRSSPGLYTRSLVIISLNVIVLSLIFTIYDVHIPISSSFEWAIQRAYKISRIRWAVDGVRSLVGLGRLTITTAAPRTAEKNKIRLEPELDAKVQTVFTPDQLALFDGSRPSKPVYLALLGRVYDVDKGRKHYSAGGGYHFFAGRDASRAFVTGDFSVEGLVDEISDFGDQEMLSISDWIGFYDKEYGGPIGVVEGRFYDSDGKLSAYGEMIREKLAAALEFRRQQVRENVVFPACNSEWHKDRGGRVWCSEKSGGVKREWSGVPRRLFAPGAKNYRCACVKNFGSPLTTPGAEGTHGDLANPHLKEYPNCPPTANSCKIGGKDEEEDD